MLLEKVNTGHMNPLESLANDSLTMQLAKLVDLSNDIFSLMPNGYSADVVFPQSQKHTRC